MKLVDYTRMKYRPEKEWFLSESRVLVRRWVKLRAGVEQLEVEMGRYKGIVRAHRICQACGEGVEDVQHVLDICVRLRERRKSMWSKLAAIDVKMVRVALGWSTRDRVDWLLKGARGR